MIKYVQSIIAVILGIISSFSDFKDKKIYNKNLKFFLIISLVTYIIFFNQLELNYLKNYILNLIICIFLSFLFYYFKIWAAGDAKLFITIIFMIPYEVYGTSKNILFPAIYLLIIIFSIAFIYVVIESLYLWVKDKEKINIKKIEKKNIKEYLIHYFFGYFIILLINNILSILIPDIIYYNASLIMISNMLILIFIYQIITKIKTIKYLTTITLILNILYYMIYGFSYNQINIKTTIIVLIILLFRKISEKYNYEEISIDKLKSRMILSYTSVMKFYGSKVKGLPLTTTESTDSRLTETEVESIKRWSKTKKGTSTIVIVKHLPFAPFILVGEIVFFIIKLYIK